MRLIVERLGALDQAWLARLARRPAPPWVDRFFRLVTHAGGATWTASLPLVLLLAPPSRTFGATLLVANAASHLCVQLLKRTVVRRRPHLVPGGPLALAGIPDAFSFPSGHAAAAMALALPCLVLGGAAGLPAFLLALLVGASRVHLRVHYPTDVLAGQLLGAGGGMLAIAIMY